MASSRFQKKGAPKIPAVPGTRPSLFNYQLLTSCGIPGLDQLIGGGLPLGTVTLLEDLPHGKSEETGQNYTYLLIQYFLAEGCFFEHKLFHGQISTSGNVQLPAIVSNQSKESYEHKAGNDELKIAWRYENQSPKGEELAGKTGNHHFNLNKTIPQESVTNLLKTWCYEPDLNTRNGYCELYKIIAEAAKPFLIDPKSPGTNMLRISISDIGSLAMSSDLPELLKFLYRLRILARSHLIVIVLSLSKDFFASNEVNDLAHKKVKELVDFVIDLTAFNKHERQNGTFREHHGLIELEKATPLNCLTNSANANNVRTKHLFKSLRTKFSIAPMHLPPDMEITKAEEKLKTLDF